MPDTIAAVIDYCSRRYSETNNPQHQIAYSTIIRQTLAFHHTFSSPESGPALLDWLSTPHPDALLARACKEVLEQLGSADQPTQPPKG